MSFRKGLILGTQVAVLTTVVCVAVVVSRASDWQPIALIGLLFALAVGSDMLSVELGGVRVSGAFLAIVLAMVLLGPASAAAMGLVSALLDAIFSRRTWDRALNNVMTWAAFPLLGGLLFHVLVGSDANASVGLWFPAAVLIVFMATNFLNFLMVATFHRVASEPPCAITSARSTSRSCPRSSPPDC